MLYNYMKLAIRNFKRHKFHSFVNVLGLTIGISAVILVFLFVKFQYSFDSFHKNIDNIFRVSVTAERNGEFDGESHIFVAPLAETMYTDLPGITNYCRISTSRSSYFYKDNEPYKIGNIRFADSTFFDLFTFNIVSGSATKALADPFSIVLSKSESNKIFGNINSVGKTVLRDNQIPYTVTAVVEDNPANSSIKFSALISFSTLYTEPGHYMDWNGGNQYIHYIALDNNVKPIEIESKLPDLMWKYLNKDLAGIGIKFTSHLQKFSDIHLNYNYYSDDLKNNIMIFTVIAALILLIACVNFINFSTAKSIKRAKEIGVRKVLGAHRSKLIYQVLVESLLITTFAVVLSLILVELLLPGYRNLIGEQIPSFNLLNPFNLIGLMIIILAAGLLSGFYPALHLTKFEAVKVLHGTAVTGRSKTLFRNALIVLQYTIAIALIITTVFVIRQLSLIKNYNIGFNKDDILVLNLSTVDLQNKYGLLKKELLKLPPVKSVSASSDIPYKGFTSNGYFPEGFTEPVMINVVDVDPDFFSTFDLTLKKGSDFPDNAISKNDDYIVNEKFVHTMGWDKAIGKTIRRNGIHYIRAVVKDFNFESLYNNIKPLIITATPYKGRFDYLAVKLNMSNISHSLEQIQTTWKNIAPNNPFEYWFLDDAFNSTYKAESNFREGFSVLSAIAVVISLLGLIGLISFTTEQRVKEIGIRKILGASVIDVVAGLTKPYLYIVTTAVIIAWAASFYFVNSWLEQFAYRTGQSFWIYLITGIIAMLTATITTAFVVLKAANANPVESLKYE